MAFVRIKGNSNKLTDNGNPNQHRENSRNNREIQDGKDWRIQKMGSHN